MSTPSPPNRLLLTYLAIVAVTSLAVGLPYWVPNWQLPKTEDFEYTVLPTMLFIQQVFQGTTNWWNPDVGLGSPWPIPTGMTHSPFSLLFLWLPPMSVVGIVAAAHTFLMGISALALFRRMGLSSWVLATAILTLQLSTALEYLYWSDAIAVYVTWTLVAPLFLMTDIILRDPLRSATAAALGMGGIVGYICLNGHTGVLATYLIGLAIFVLLQPRILLRRIPLFMLAIAFAAAIGAEKLVYLLLETQRFGSDVYRDQQGLNGGLLGIIHNSLLRPLFLPDPRYLFELKGWLSGFVSANNFSRTLGFGVVFTVLAFIAIFRRSLIEPFSKHRAVAVTFVIALLLMLWPIGWLPVAISATWPLRDVVLIMGIILAGHAFVALGPSITARWGPRGPARLLAVQCALVLTSALALIAGPNWLVTRGKETVGFYNSLATEQSSPYLAALTEALGRDGEPGGRYIATGEAERMMDVEMMIGSGAINNIGPIHGLAEVSFIAKGVSYDTIRPSQLVPYGTIAGDRMKVWALDREELTDWTRDDLPLLAFLGIETIVAAIDEPVGAEGLTKVADLQTDEGIGMSIYQNPTVLPLSFEVPAALLDGAVEPRKDCTGNGLYCLDLTRIVGAADLSAVDMQISGDRFTVDTRSAQSDRSVLITQMYRPEWRLDEASLADGANLSSWNGIMRLDLPSGLAAVQAYYGPTSLISARQVTTAGFTLWAAALLAMLVARMLLPRNRAFS